MLRKIINWMSYRIKLLRPLYETRNTAAPITVKGLLMQKVLGFNRKAYWPMHFTSTAGPVENILIGIGTAPGLSPGCYISANGKIRIGDYTIIAPNVGIISSNHSLVDSRDYDIGVVNIGKYCWLGMNSLVLPNVTLGDYTIVGAGAVVTKSFPDGYCVIAGNPAKIIKYIDKSECIKYNNEFQYYGYIRKDKFSVFKSNKLNF